jgi:hypothetical protein
MVVAYVTTSILVKVTLKCPSRSNRTRLDEVTADCPSPNLHKCPDSLEELIAGQPRSIWSTYAKIAERFDEKLVERWNSDMDVLLVYVS